MEIRKEYVGSKCDRHSVKSKDEQAGEKVRDIKKRGVTWNLESRGTVNMDRSFEGEERDSGYLKKANMIGDKQISGTHDSHRLSKLNQTNKKSINVSSTENRVKPSLNEDSTWGENSTMTTEGNESSEDDTSCSMTFDDYYSDETDSPVLLKDTQGTVDTMHGSICSCWYPDDQIKKRLNDLRCFPF